MTSMLLTASRGSKASPLYTIARRDLALRGVLRRGLLDLGPHDRLVARDPVADHLPLLSVPLLELHRAAAFVVEARDLHRLHQVEGAELLEALLVDLQVLDAPAHFLAAERPLAELRLRGAHGLGGENALDHAAVEVLLADAVAVLHVAALAAGVHVLQDLLHHLELGARGMERRG